MQKNNKIPDFIDVTAFRCFGQGEAAIHLMPVLFDADVDVNVEFPLPEDTTLDGKRIVGLGCITQDDCLGSYSYNGIEYVPLDAAEPAQFVIALLKDVKKKRDGKDQEGTETILDEYPLRRICNQTTQGGNAIYRANFLATDFTFDVGSSYLKKTDGAAIVAPYAILLAFMYIP